MADPAYIDQETGVLTDPEAWLSLGSTTLGSDTAMVTFTNPDDGSSLDWGQFMDLVIIWYARCADSGAQLTYLSMRFNNDTASFSYPYQYVRGNGANVSSGESQGQTSILLGMYPQDSFMNGIYAAGVCHIFDINSGKYKTLLQRTAADLDAADTGNTWLGSVIWKKQEALTEIDIYQMFGEDHKAGSRFDLFGVFPRMVV